MQSYQSIFNRTAKPSPTNALAPPGSPDVSELRRRNEGLQNQLERALVMVQQTEKELSEVKADNTSLCEAVETVREDDRIHRHEIEQAMSEVSALFKALEARNGESLIAFSTNSSLAEQLKVLRTSLMAEEGKVAGSLQTPAELSHVQNELSRIPTDILALPDDEIQHLVSDRNRLILENATLAQKLSEAGSVVKERDQLRIHLDSLQMQLAKVSGLTPETPLQQYVAVQQEELSQLREAVESVSAPVDESQTGSVPQLSTDELAAQLEKIKTTHQQGTELLQDELKSLASAHRVLRSEMVRTDDEIRLREELQQAKHDLEAVQRQLADVKLAKETSEKSLESQITNLQRQLTQLTFDFQSKQDSLIALQAAAHEARSSPSKLAELKSLQTQLIEAISQRDEARMTKQIDDDNYAKALTDMMALQSHLAEQTSQVDSLKRENGKLTETVTKLTSEIAELSKSSEAATAELSARDSEVTRLRSENETLLHQVESLRSEHGSGKSAFSSQIAEQSTRLSEQTTTIDSLRQQLDTVKEEHEKQMKENNLSSYAQVDNIASQLAKETALVASLQEELQITKQSLEAESKRTAELSDNVASAAKTISDLESRRSELTSELAEQTTLREESVRECDALRTQLTALSTELESLKSVKAELEGKQKLVDELTVKLTTAERKAEAFQNMLHDTAPALDSLRDQLAASQSETAEARAELEKATADLEQHRQQVEQHRQEIEQHKSDLEQLTETSQSKLAQTGEHEALLREELEKQITRYRSQAGEATSQLSNVLSELAEVSLQLGVANETLKEVEEAREEVQLNFTETSALLTKLQSESAVHVQSSDTLRGQLSELQSQYDQVKQQLVDLEQERTKSMKERDQLRASNVELGNIIRSTNEENEKLVAETTKLRADLASQAKRTWVMEQALMTRTTQMQEAEGARTALQHQLNEMTTQLQEVKDSMSGLWERDKLSWRDEVAVLEAEKQKLTADRSAAETECKRVQKEMEKLQRKVAKQTLQLEKARNDLDLMRAELPHMKEALLAAEQTANDERSRNAALQTELQESVTKFMDVLNKLDAARAELSSGPSVAVQEQLSTLDATVQLQAKQLTDSKLEIDRLTTELAAVTKEAEKTKSIQAERVAVEKKLAALRAEHEKAQQSHSSMSKQISSLEREMQSLREMKDAQIKQLQADIASGSFHLGEARQEQLQHEVVVNGLRSEIQSLRQDADSHVGQLNQQLSSLSFELAQAHHRYNELVANSISRDEEMSELRGAFDQCQAALQYETEHLNQVIVQSQQLSATLQEQLNEERNATKQARAEQQRLKEECAEIQKRMNEVSVQKDAQIGDLDQQLVTLQNEVQRLKEKHASYEEHEASQLRETALTQAVHLSEMEQLRSEISVLEKAEKKREDDNARLREELVQCQRRVEELEAKEQSEKSDVSSQIIALTAERDALNETLQSREQLMSATKEEHTATVAHLQGQIEHVKKEMKELTAKFDSERAHLQAEISKRPADSEMQHKLEEETKRADELSRALTSSQAELLQAKTLYTAQTAALQTRVKELEETDKSGGVSAAEYQKMKELADYRLGEFSRALASSKQSEILLQECQAECNSLKEQLMNGSMAAVDGLLTEIQQQVAELQSENEKLKQKLAANRSKSNGDDVELGEYKTRVRELETQLTQAEVECEKQTQKAEEALILAHTYESQLERMQLVRDAELKVNAARREVEQARTPAPLSQRSLSFDNLPSTPAPSSLPTSLASPSPSFEVTALRQQNSALALELAQTKEALERVRAEFAKIAATSATQLNSEIAKLGSSEEAGVRIHESLRQTMSTLEQALRDAQTRKETVTSPPPLSISSPTIGTTTPTPTPSQVQQEALRSPPSSQADGVLRQHHTRSMSDSPVFSSTDSPLLNAMRLIPPPVSVSTTKMSSPQIMITSQLTPPSRTGLSPSPLNDTATSRSPGGMAAITHESQSMHVRLNTQLEHLQKILKERSSPKKEETKPYSSVPSIRPPRLSNSHVSGQAVSTRFGGEPLKFASAGSPLTVRPVPPPLTPRTKASVSEVMKKGLAQHKLSSNDLLRSSIEPSPAEPLDTSDGLNMSHIPTPTSMSPVSPSRRLSSATGVSFGSEISDIPHNASREIGKRPPLQKRSSLASVDSISSEVLHHHNSNPSISQLASPPRSPGSPRIMSPQSVLKSRAPPMETARDLIEHGMQLYNLWRSAPADAPVTQKYLQKLQLCFTSTFVAVKSHLESMNRTVSLQVTSKALFEEVVFRKMAPLEWLSFIASQLLECDVEEARAWLSLDNPSELFA